MPAERSGIELRVDDRLRIDVTLSLGQVSETVSVEATAPIVNTDSATLGNVVDNKKVTELPLNGRNYEQLILLAPGVQSLASTSRPCSRRRWAQAPKVGP